MLAKRERYMDQQNDVTTKQRILIVSIDLFSQKSFRDVSVREIAKAVGIKASSLYKHYESKESILESIFELFKEKMSRTAFSKDAIRQYVCSISPQKYFDDSFDLFKHVMWSPEIVKISKIITIEQQRSRPVREFFLQELIEEPTQMLQYVLELMMERGMIAAADTRVLAEEYTSYVVYLYFEQNFLKEVLSLDEIERKMRQHNDFYANYILKK
jgi:AcrR family transcriptional regulator